MNFDKGGRGGGKPPRIPPTNPYRHPSGRSCNTEIVLAILTLGMWWVIPVVRYHVRGGK